MGRARTTESAKKRREREENRRRNVSRIYLGTNYDRWSSLRDRSGRSSIDLISHLLDVHERFCECSAGLAMDTEDADVTTSVCGSVTPPCPATPCHQISTPVGFIATTPCHIDASRIMDDSESTFMTEPSPRAVSTPSEASYASVLEDASDVTEGDDEDYDPNLSDTRATLGDDVDLTTVEEDLLNLPLPDSDDTDVPLPDTTEPLLDIISAQKFIGFVGPILDLVKLKAGTTCSRPSCTADLVFSHRLYGTALVVRWECTSGHSCGSWASQPRVNRMFSGNLQLATNILFTGNAYRKIALLFKFLNLGCVGESTYYLVQRLYAAPAVDSYWTMMQTRLLSEKVRQRQAVRVAGDGRNDSPGHSAQFCTYSFADLDTDAILHIEVVDVRQATSSVAMEKLGFLHGLDFLRDKVNITEVVTDQSPSISKVMRVTPEYQGITHQYDIWHAAKNLEKRLTARCKPNSVLRQWITPIKNHFWWSAQACKGQTVKMKEIWIRVLSHACNIHEWQVAGHTEGRCSHTPLNTEDRERPWLQKEGPEMDTLREVVTEPRFLKQFDHFRNFRHTGALESFNSHILMYSPKRHAYQFIGYRARNQLAVIDHNHHLHRPEQMNSAGETMYKGLYSKRTKRWRPQVEKLEKNYSYSTDLQLLVFKEKDQEKGGMKRKAPMLPEDPRHIGRTIAKRPCPPIADLVKERVSRFFK